MNQLEKEKTPEEIEFIKLERKENPITGEKGSKISSDNMRRLWISLMKLNKEMKANQTHFRKIKHEYRMQSIDDMIEDVQARLKYE